MQLHNLEITRMDANADKFIIDIDFDSNNYEVSVRYRGHLPSNLLDTIRRAAVTG